jgi:organic radical activating enzyme
MDCLVTIAATDASLVVAEVYGRTVQGEGPSIGRLASFLRLGGCNLSCSWCDSAYTWDANRYDLRQELTRRDVGELADLLIGWDTPLIIITGGEPLLHQHQGGWAALLAKLTGAGKQIEIETNGTIVPGPVSVEHVSRFNVSPKLANSGDSAARRIHPRALRVMRDLALKDAAIFKFVCQAPSDLDQVAAIAATYRIPSDRIWIMPEGTNGPGLTATTRELADRAIAERYNLTPRLHIQIWGDDRGR